MDVHVKSCKYYSWGLPNTSNLSLLLVKQCQLFQDRVSFNAMLSAAGPGRGEWEQVLKLLGKMPLGLNLGGWRQIFKQASEVWIYMAGYTININKPFHQDIYIYVYIWYIQHGLARPIRIIAIQSWKNMILWDCTLQHWGAIPGMNPTTSAAAQLCWAVWEVNAGLTAEWWRQLVLLVASGGMTGGLPSGNLT